MKRPATKSRPTAHLKNQGEASRSNPKWSWHCRVLLELRDRLRSEQGVRLETAAAEVEPHSSHIADSATDEFDHNLALSELSLKSVTLYEVDEAINRIEQGTYGVCMETGKPISPARLRAIPWARFSREVEEHLEKTGAISTPALGRAGSVRDPVVSARAGEAPEDEVSNPEAADEALEPLSFSSPLHPYRRQQSAKAIRKRASSSR